jgi:hypothetical protein
MPTNFYCTDQKNEAKYCKGKMALFVENGKSSRIGKERKNGSII